MVLADPADAVAAAGSAVPAPAQETAGSTPARSGHAAEAGTTRTRRAADGGPAAAAGQVASSDAATVAAQLQPSTLPPVTAAGAASDSPAPDTTLAPDDAVAGAGRHAATVLAAGTDASDAASAFAASSLPSALPDPGAAVAGPAVVADPAADTAALAAATQAATATGSAAPANPVVATRPATAGPAVATPAAQLAPALIALHPNAAGQQSLMLRLTPAELGTVQVEVSHAHDGTASVTVTAERPETLQLLQHDHQQLSQALDQAGVSSEGRNLSFSLAADGAFSNGGGGQAAGQGGQNAGTNAGSRRAWQGWAGEDSASASALPQTPAGWQRAGINITA